MYISARTVAGGSSGDEILFPCQIKASAASSVVADLGGSHNAYTRRKKRQMRRKTLGEEVRDFNQRPGLWSQAERMSEDSLVPDLL